jgi:transcriptional antiterminator NusG
MEKEVFKWYILNVVSGQENKIASEIKLLIMNGGLQNRVSEVLVPTKAVLKVKRGQKVQEQQKLFPGYIFINGSVVGDVKRLLRLIPKVIGFLGSKNDPQPVSEQKMTEIFGLTSTENLENKTAQFEIGESLNIIEGPFESFSGSVEQFDVERQKVKLSVLIFGRSTTVELDVNQVEKISE